MADEDLNRPYIGYRSAGRRPESQQDRRASADAPLAALRGFLSGVLGAPGDIESLVRMLPGLSERTILPTSEDVERRLPLRSVSETPIGRAATSGAQLAGGFYNGPGSPLRAVAALPSAVSRAGREFLQSGVPAHVIKPKGGNWLTGSVEKAIAPLKRPELPMPTAEDLAGIGNDPRVLAELERRRIDPALNKWLDTKLAKYMRNEMATPEDPIRTLAEQGVLHFTPERQILNSTTAFQRSDAGFPRHGVAQAQLAKNWEDLADQAILPRTAGQQLMAEYPYNAETMPWLEKVPPETMVYAARSRSPEELGFRHLRDELRNALNPESGLPANLLLTPEQLGRVSTPQAVELVHKINEYRAAEKAAADAARAQNAATVLHKEYPEAGYKWVELKARGPKATSIEGAKSDQELIRKELEDALQYEGDTMGHCVGGYCPDVLEGRSRIFSLRSAKGEPHVTIEVQPRSSLPRHDEIMAELRKRSVFNTLEGTAYDIAYDDAMKALEANPPLIIKQIKGKANRAPKEDYLPYVQDFVRSQKWGDIGDFQNAGLYDVESRESLQRLAPRIFPQENEYVGAKMLQELLPPGDQRYFTEQELRDLVQSQNKAQGFASGGLVTYNPAEVERLTAPLRAELGLQ